MSNLIKEINRKLQSINIDPKKPTIVVTMKRKNYSEDYKRFIEYKKRFDKGFIENKPKVLTYYFDIDNTDLNFITNVNNHNFTTYGKSLFYNFIRGVDFDYYIEKIELFKYVDDFEEFSFEDITELKEG